LKFLGICVGIGILYAVEKTLFGVTGENLTAAVRVDLVKGILFKQLCWFDRESRAPGILTNVLSEDVQSLNGMTTETISTVVEAFLGLFLGLLVAMFFSWQ
jgi:ABC-type multidrug transport system fused ATPase/permease subunit